MDIWLAVIKFIAQPRPLTFCRQKVRIAPLSLVAFFSYPSIPATMFCSFFCHSKKTEATKPSAIEIVIDEQEVVEQTVASPFPHLKHLNQPIGPCDDDDTSISEDSLFEPVIEMEQKISNDTPILYKADLVPFDEPESVVQEQSDEQHYDQKQQEQEVVSKTISSPEEPIQVTKGEFIAALEKIEKENAWFQKRQAKKATGKKKSRRNNKKCKQHQESFVGLQQPKRARSNALVAPRDIARVPLGCRN